MLGLKRDFSNEFTTAYVSPSSDGSKAKTVIFITDIFGYELVNVRLVADEYAAQGFHVVVPDLFEGMFILIFTQSFLHLLSGSRQLVAYKLLTLCLDFPYICGTILRRLRRPWRESTPAHVFLQ